MNFDIIVAIFETFASPPDQVLREACLGISLVKDSLNLVFLITHFNDKVEDKVYTFI